MIAHCMKVRSSGINEAFVKVFINGWDLQKALRLLHSSNPTLFEWNNSPIVYKTTPEWAEISVIIELFFQKKAGLYHYLSTAKKNYREYNDCFEEAPVAEDRATSLAREVCKLQATPKCRKSLPDVDTLVLAGTPGYPLRQGPHLLT